MMPKLKALIRRAETWPEEAQDRLVQAGLEIEAEQAGAYIASPDELKAIDEALDQLANGDLATGQEVEAAFAKLRSG